MLTFLQWNKSTLLHRLLQWTTVFSISFTFLYLFFPTAQLLLQMLLLVLLLYSSFHFSSLNFNWVIFILCHPRPRTDDNDQDVLSEQIFFSSELVDVVPPATTPFISSPLQVVDYTLKLLSYPQNFHIRAEAATKSRKEISDDALLIPQSIFRPTESAREAWATRRQSELYWKVETRRRRGTDNWTMNGDKKSAMVSENFPIPILSWLCPTPQLLVQADNEGKKNKKIPCTAREAHFSVPTKGTFNYLIELCWIEFKCCLILWL